MPVPVLSILRLACHSTPSAAVMFLFVRLCGSKDTAAAAAAAAAMDGDATSRTGVFELRTYQLELGYNPIPKLIGHMADGLPSKLASDPGAAGPAASIRACSGT